MLATRVCPIAELPEDLLDHILHLLSPRERLRASGACRAWRRLCVTGPSPIMLQSNESVSEAVERARPGQYILLASGRYEETALLDKQVHLIGSRGAILAAPDGHALACLGPASPSVSGLTIRGRGVLVSGRSRALIEDCDVVSWSTGVFVTGEGTRPTLRGNIIRCCRHEGVIFNTGAGGVLEGCEISGCQGSGVHVCEGADPELRGNGLRPQVSLGRGVRTAADGRGRPIVGRVLELLQERPGDVRPGVSFRLLLRALAPLLVPRTARRRTQPP